MVNPNILPLLVEGKDPSHAALETEFARAFLELYNSAPPEIQEGMRIYSGHRSEEHQARLFADAVKKYGSEAAARKWVAPPGRSRHNHGRAADLKYASPEVREWIHANAANYGLGFPMDHEPWHIELAGDRAAGVAPKGDFMGAPPQQPRQQAEIPDMDTALAVREMMGAETIPDSDLGGLFQALQPMADQLTGMEVRGKNRRMDAGKQTGPEPQFQFPFELGNPGEMGASLQPREPVVAEPVERTELGALLQHISGGLQPPPSPAPRPGSRLR